MEFCRSGIRAAILFNQKEICLALLLWQGVNQRGRRNIEVSGACAGGAPRHHGRGIILHSPSRARMTDSLPILNSRSITDLPPGVLRNRDSPGPVAPDGTAGAAR